MLAHCPALALSLHPTPASPLSHASQSQSQYLRCCSWFTRARLHLVSPHHNPCTTSPHTAYSPAHNMHLIAAGGGRRKPRKLCTPAHCRSRRRQRRSRRCGWRRCGWRRRRPCRRRSRCYLHTLNPGDPIIPSSTQNTQIQS